MAPTEQQGKNKNCKFPIFDTFGKIPKICKNPLASKQVLLRTREKAHNKRERCQ